MGLPIFEHEKSGQWSMEKRRDSRNEVRTLHDYSHHQLIANRVAPGAKLWTPERASWASWLLSSFAMSAVFTSLLSGRPLAMIQDLFLGAEPHLGGAWPETATTSSTTESTLHAPLERRASCQSGGADAASYNLPLRVGALFIILAVSSAACAFPILVVKLPGLRIPDTFFFAVRHFGTGVLIATAFVHLLPTAFTLLGDPCLSRFWTKDFQAMPGAIALFGIFVVTVIEMLLHPARRTPAAGRRAASSEVRAKRPVVGRSESIGRTLSNINNRASIDAIQASARRDDGASPPKEAVDEEAEDAEAGLPTSSLTVLSDQQKHRKEIMQIVLLEMGILFHSVFIGMALSVSIGGNEFVVLLIAIAFHQTFEGLALGARIAAIEWPEKSLQPIFMAVAYGCTTPVGQAIGLAARSAYSPESEVGLILVGVMNAISAGLLTFASLVELLSEDLLSDESWRILRGRRRVCAFALVVAGAFLMSLVGAWA
ncbi:Zinc/iron permease [Apiospora kogelbergensis]|uniref:Zinc/iron permease n=1 Tax=Apiospora kogelbergensis TaxID=1337665 RepID=UPI00312E4C59